MEEVREMVLEVIKEKFNFGFTAKQLGREIVCKLEGVGLQDIFKDNEGKFENVLHFFRCKFAYLLTELKKEGYIEKYSKNMWQINKKRLSKWKH